MTIEIEIKWNYNLLNLNVYIFAINLLSIIFLVCCRFIFENDENMIFCDMEKPFWNKKKIDKFCDKEMF